MTTWSDEQLQFLKTRFEAGDSASQIALQMGGAFSRNAVIGKLHRLNLRRSKVLAPRSTKKSEGHPWAGRARQKPTLMVARSAAADSPAGEPIIVPAPEPVEPTSRGVTIHALDAAFRMCRWIVKEDPQRRGRDRYCGADSVMGHCWCAWHKAMVFTKATGPNPQPDRKVVHKPSMGDRSFGAVQW